MDTFLVNYCYFLMHMNNRFCSFMLFLSCLLVYILRFNAFFYSSTSSLCYFIFLTHSLSPLFLLLLFILLLFLCICLLFFYLCNFFGSDRSVRFFSYFIARLFYFSIDPSLRLCYFFSFCLSCSFSTQSILSSLFSSMFACCVWAGFAISKRTAAAAAAKVGPD